jgi:hypothetical protein
LGGGDRKSAGNTGGFFQMEEEAELVIAEGEVMFSTFKSGFYLIGHMKFFDSPA